MVGGVEVEPDRSLNALRVKAEATLSSNEFLVRAVATVALWRAGARAYGSTWQQV